MPRTTCKIKSANTSSEWPPPPKAASIPALDVEDLVSDLSNMTDAAVIVSIDRCRNQLMRSWERGGPGSVTALYDLARLVAESEVRGLALRGRPMPGQLRLVLGDQRAAPR